VSNVTNNRNNVYLETLQKVTFNFPDVDEGNSFHPNKWTSENENIRTASNSKSMMKRSNINVMHHRFGMDQDWFY
jgi:hypothetical protein